MVREIQGKIPQYHFIRKAIKCLQFLLTEFWGQTHSVPRKVVPWGPGKSVEMVSSSLHLTGLAALTIKHPVTKAAIYLLLDGNI